MLIVTRTFFVACLPRTRGRDTALQPKHPAGRFLPRTLGGMCPFRVGIQTLLCVDLLYFPSLPSLILATSRLQSLPPAKTLQRSSMQC